MSSDLPEVTFWGDRLVRWPSDVVAKMELDPADAAYLTDVGLPAEVDNHLELAPPASGSEAERIDGMPILGFDVGVPLCIDKADGGALVWFDTTSRARAVSSNLRRFGACLALYEDFLVRVRRLDDDDELAREDLVNETEARMRKIDPEPMRDPESFWRVIFEMARDGF